MEKNVLTLTCLQEAEIFRSATHDSGSFLSYFPCFQIDKSDIGFRRSHDGENSGASCRVDKERALGTLDTGFRELTSTDRFRNAFSQTNGRRRHGSQTLRVPRTELVSKEQAIGGGEKDALTFRQSLSQTLNEGVKGFSGCHNDGVMDVFCSIPWFLGN